MHHSFAIWKYVFNSWKWVDGQKQGYKSIIFAIFVIVYLLC